MTIPLTQCPRCEEHECNGKCQPFLCWLEEKHAGNKQETEVFYAHSYEEAAENIIHRELIHYYIDEDAVQEGRHVWVSKDDEIKQFIVKGEFTGDLTVKYTVSEVR